MVPLMVPGHPLVLGLVLDRALVPLMERERA